MFSHSSAQTLQTFQTHRADRQRDLKEKFDPAHHPMGQVFGETPSILSGAPSWADLLPPTEVMTEFNFLTSKKSQQLEVALTALATKLTETFQDVIGLRSHLDFFIITTLAIGNVSASVADDRKLTQINLQLIDQLCRQFAANTHPQREISIVNWLTQSNSTPAEITVNLENALYELAPINESKYIIANYKRNVVRALAVDEVHSQIGVDIIGNNQYDAIINRVIAEFAEGLGYESVLTELAIQNIALLDSICAAVANKLTNHLTFDGLIHYHYRLQAAVLTTKQALTKSSTVSEADQRGMAQSAQQLIQWGVIPATQQTTPLTDTMTLYWYPNLTLCVAYIKNSKTNNDTMPFLAHMNDQIGVHPQPIIIPTLSSERKNELAHSIAVHLREWSITRLRYSTIGMQQGFFDHLTTLFAGNLLALFQETDPNLTLRVSLLEVISVDVEAMIKIIAPELNQPLLALTDYSALVGFFARSPSHHVSLKELLLKTSTQDRQTICLLMLQVMNAWNFSHDVLANKSMYSALVAGMTSTEVTQLRLMIATHALRLLESLHSFTTTPKQAFYESMLAAEIQANPDALEPYLKKYKTKLDLFRFSRICKEHFVAAMKNIKPDVIAEVFIDKQEDDSVTLTRLGESIQQFNFDTKLQYASLLPENLQYWVMIQLISSFRNENISAESGLILLQMCPPSRRAACMNDLLFGLETSHGAGEHYTQFLISAIAYIDSNEINRVSTQHLELMLGWSFQPELFKQAVAHLFQHHLSADTALSLLKILQPLWKKRASIINSPLSSSKATALLGLLDLIDILQKTEGKLSKIRAALTVIIANACSSLARECTQADCNELIFNHDFKRLLHLMPADALADMARVASRDIVTRELEQPYESASSLFEYVILHPDVSVDWVRTSTSYLSKEFVQKTLLDIFAAKNNEARLASSPSRQVIKKLFSVAPPSALHSLMTLVLTNGCEFELFFDSLESYKELLAIVDKQQLMQALRNDCRQALLTRDSRHGDYWDVTFDTLKTETDLDTFLCSLIAGYPIQSVKNSSLLHSIYLHVSPKQLAELLQSKEAALALVLTFPAKSLKQVVERLPEKEYTAFFKMTAFALFDVEPTVKVIKRLPGKNYTRVLKMAALDSYATIEVSVENIDERLAAFKRIVACTQQETIQAMMASSVDGTTVLTKVIAYKTALEAMSQLLIDATSKQAFAELAEMTFTLFLEHADATDMCEDSVCRKVLRLVEWLPNTTLNTFTRPSNKLIYNLVYFLCFSLQARPHAFAVLLQHLPVSVLKQHLTALNINVMMKASDYMRQAGYPHILYVVLKNSSSIDGCALLEKLSNTHLDEITQPTNSAFPAGFWYGLLNADALKIMLTRVSTYNLSTGVNLLLLNQHFDAEKTALMFQRFPFAFDQQIKATSKKQLSPEMQTLCEQHKQLMHTPAKVMERDPNALRNFISQRIIQPQDTEENQKWLTYIEKILKQAPHSSSIRNHLLVAAVKAGYAVSLHVSGRQNDPTVKKHNDQILGWIREIDAPTVLATHDLLYLQNYVLSLSSAPGDKVIVSHFANIIAERNAPLIKQQAAAPVLRSPEIKQEEKKEREEKLSHGHGLFASMTLNDRKEQAESKTIANDIVTLVKAIHDLQPTENSLTNVVTATQDAMQANQWAECLFQLKKCRQHEFLSGQPEILDRVKVIESKVQSLCGFLSSATIASVAAMLTNDAIFKPSHSERLIVKQLARLLQNATTELEQKVYVYVLCNVKPADPDGAFTMSHFLYQQLQGISNAPNTLSALRVSINEDIQNVEIDMHRLQQEIISPLMTVIANEKTEAANYEKIQASFQTLHRPTYKR